MADLLDKTLLEKIRTGDHKMAPASLLGLLRRNDLFTRGEAFTGTLVNATYIPYTGQKEHLLAVVTFMEIEKRNTFCYADIRDDAEGWGFILNNYDVINPKIRYQDRKVKMEFYDTAAIDLQMWKTTYHLV